ncbi:LysR family transcriptional regulator [Pseudomonas sp. BN414]|uniref:LysR family transcriptional regulator n=1 Tax=Pseudomonas TaxID=286 RepID=UPI0015BC277C|nr:MULTISPECIES: LysR family transcriptional regulator [Pseudomonas]MDH4565620.1 LysR family transcriptional regulator [Pseudomonas sp. BN414]NWL76045.1 LysR family transcriptional regulator [Pseudomonas taiwanensis]
MMLPKLMHIRMFVAVYEEGSFTVAASREGLGQSGVSAHVRQLETQLGVRLFSRDHAIVPTPAGHAYYQQCVQLLRLHESACNAVGRRAEPSEGTLRIGMIPTMTRSVFSRALRVFETAYPNVSVQLTEGTGSVLATAVRRGMLDFAITQRMSYEAGGASGLGISLFTRTPAFLVSSPNSDLPHCEPIRLSKIEDLYLVLPVGRRPLLEQYLIDHKVRVAQRLNWFESMLGAMDLVRSSHWTAIISGLFIADDLRRRRFTLNPLADPILWDEMLLVEPARKPLAPIAQNFIDLLRQATEEINAIPIRIAYGDKVSSLGQPSMSEFRHD